MAFGPLTSGISVEWAKKRYFDSYFLDVYVMAKVQLVYKNFFVALKICKLSLNVIRKTIS